MAAASFLARYGGRTLEAEAYRHDQRGFFQGAADQGSPCSLRFAEVGTGQPARIVDHDPSPPFAD